jgi:hypothetical protein
MSAVPSFFVGPGAVVAFAAGADFVVVFAFPGLTVCAAYCFFLQVLSLRGVFKLNESTNVRPTRKNTVS